MTAFFDIGLVGKGCVVSHTNIQVQCPAVSTAAKVAVAMGGWRLVSELIQRKMMLRIAIASVSKVRSRVSLKA